MVDPATRQENRTREGRGVSPASTDESSQTHPLGRILVAAFGYMVLAGILQTFLNTTVLPSLGLEELAPIVSWVLTAGLLVVMVSEVVMWQKGHRHAGAVTRAIRALLAVVIASAPVVVLVSVGPINPVVVWESAATYCNGWSQAESFQALTRRQAMDCLIRGNDPNEIIAEDGRTPLHIAALTGDTALVRLLLLAGAEPQVTDYLGNTPLHAATTATTSQAYLQMIDLLVAAGADSTATNTLNQTPWDGALANPTVVGTPEATRFRPVS